MTELAAHDVQVDSSVKTKIPNPDTLSVADGPSVGSLPDISDQSSISVSGDPYITKGSINRLRNLGKLMRR